MALLASPTLYEDPIATMETELASARGRNLFPTTNGLEVIVPSVEIIGAAPDGEFIMRHLEAAIRTAYKSEDAIGPGSHEKILKHILSLKHESTLEHIAMSFRAVTSRGVSHELVRHRIASYTQESTRYVNYGKKPPQVILPWHLLGRDDDDMIFWLQHQRQIIAMYLEALERGWKPQDARGFLPNDLKTEIVFTMNLRSLRNFLTLRTAPAAHPDMQVLARRVLKHLMATVPLIFQDIQDRLVTPTPATV